MSTPRRLIAISLAVLGVTGLANAQTPATPASGPFDGLHFRSIGPATMAGRIDDFAVLERNPAVFYVATATGGLWKTTNMGTTFETVFDNQTSSSIGDVAIATTDANLVWVGTGENNNRQSSSWGDGVYKSADGGRTWANMGLRESRHIARILVDPVDHDVVYVAALGSLWGPGGDRGVFKTTDGGLTWTNVLPVGPDAGATELVMDPTNNKVIYAALYQRRRQPWGMNGGGPLSAIHKTTDAGRSWTKLENGIPEGPKGRIGLDVYRKNPNVVYARIEHATESGVYRSDDAGATWRKLSTTNPRPMYFSQIRVDPQDDSRIYVLGVQLFVSDDGGRTFRNDGARNIHVDFHAMWVNPNNSDHTMIGGDGGVGISFDRSQNYVWLRNMPLGQFYHVHYDLRSPYTVCGGLQDNNSWCGPSAVRSERGSGNDDWFIIGGGDGFVALLDPSNPGIMYAESQDGRMNRVDRATNERKTIRPEPAEGEAANRWNWDTPMVLSPHDPATVYVAANRVFKSTNRGHSWRAISPDLTTATDRDDLEIMGVKGRDTRIARNDGVGSYGNLVSFAESPIKVGLYYTGSDDGLVQVSRDGGANWTNVSAKVPNLPKNTYVSEVAPSRFDTATVYATFDGHRGNDFGSYVYASGEYGNSWRSIVSDLPKGEVARTITEDLKNPDVLYLGTETGLYVTTDRGRHWARVKANLPTVPIYEITLHPRDNDMILATHGRSIWILDELTPFQRYAEAQLADAYLFEPPAATQREPAGDRARDWEGDLRFLGENPPVGAALTYHLKSAANDVSLSIRDASGATARVLSGQNVGKGAGMNVVTWDLRVTPNPEPQGPVGGGGGGFGGGGTRGPLVLPGEYRVALTVDGKDVGTRSIRVMGDPDIQIAEADRRTLFGVVSELHTLQGNVNRAADALTQAAEQFGQVRTALSANKDAPAGLKAAIDSLSADLDSLRRRVSGLPGGGGGGGGFGGPPNLRNRIGQLKGAIMGSTSLPTEVQMRELTAVRPLAPKAVEEVNALLNRFPVMYRRLAEAGVYPVVPRPGSRS
ncbi:MAG: glycosyl hydrolase [Gemmatimonadetes bacterium]|nr:glycosyl hydrolase [Gemmatimonadota bacterium]